MNPKTNPVLEDLVGGSIRANPVSSRKIRLFLNNVQEFVSENIAYSPEKKKPQMLLKKRINLENRLKYFIDEMVDILKESEDAKSFRLQWCEVYYGFKILRKNWKAHKSDILIKDADVLLKMLENYADIKPLPEINFDKNISIIVGSLVPLSGLFVSSIPYLAKAINPEIELNQFLTYFNHLVFTPIIASPLIFKAYQKHKNSPYINYLLNKNFKQIEHIADFGYKILDYLPSKVRKTKAYQISQKSKTILNLKNIVHKCMY